MAPLSTILPHVEPKLRAWWEHTEQESPCLQLTVACEDSQRGEEGGRGPEEPADLRRYWFDAEWVTRHVVRGIDRTTYLGVSVPHHMPGLGSASMAGALGAEMEYVDQQTMWAHPCFDRLEQVLDVTWDPSRPFCRTLLELTERSVAASPDHHYVAHFPLEGVSDIIAGLYGTSEFMTDLVERPSLMKRALAHLKRIWIAVFGQVDSLIARGGNRGRCGWAGIWAPGTTFPLQEDLSHNISPAMYREFLLPHVRDMVEALDYALYHLDGERAIAHLEMLLAIPRLRAIQWVPERARRRCAPGTH